MRSHTKFLASMIDKAERRLSFQAGMVAELPTGCTSPEALLASEIFDALRIKVIDLRRRRDELIRSDLRRPSAPF